MSTLFFVCSTKRVGDPRLPGPVAPRTVGVLFLCEEMNSALQRREFRFEVGVAEIAIDKRFRGVSDWLKDNIC